jgi:DNA end-binding protein Ku
MSGDWDPAQYQDEFRERLHKVIKDRMKAHGVVKREEDEPEIAEHAATNVVDFMSLLQQSIDRKKRTPAKKASPPATAKAAKTPAKKAPRKATKKAAATKTTRRKSA